MTDIEKIARAAELSCFFIDNGHWLRIDSTDVEEGVFYCHDEETFNEYQIRFDEVNLDTDEFYQLTVVSFTGE